MAKSSRSKSLLANRRRMREMTSTLRGKSIAMITANLVQATGISMPTPAEAAKLDALPVPAENKKTRNREFFRKNKTRLLAKLKQRQERRLKTKH
eukprot:m51a1_g8157 hypothetical protein (95) ;mRNA; r:64360-64724